MTVITTSEVLNSGGDSGGGVDIDTAEGEKYSEEGNSKGVSRSSSKSNKTKRRKKRKNNKNHDPNDSSSVITIRRDELESLVNRLVQEAIQNSTTTATTNGDTLYSSSVQDSEAAIPTPHTQPTESPLSPSASRAMTAKQNVTNSTITDQDHNSQQSIEVAFEKSTAKWFVYGKQSDLHYTITDGIIGFMIISFQLAVYGFITYEAINDLQDDLVPVKIPFTRCFDVNDEDDLRMDIVFGSSSLEEDFQHRPYMDEFPPDSQYTPWVGFSPESNITILRDSSLFCDAKIENDFTAGMTFLIIMLSMFLVLDFQDSFVCFTQTKGYRRLFSCYVFLEVFSAWFSCVAIGSQKVFAGDVLEGLESGVGLLFVHDLGNRVFASFKERSDGGRKYRMFIIASVSLILCSVVLSFLLTGLVG